MRTLTLLLFSVALAPCCRAQQFVTDDAAVVEYRAVQLEGWHGESSSWILPAFQLIPNLEITTGIGRVVEEGVRKTEYVAQGKYLFQERTDSSLGVGIVAGAGFGRLPQVVGGAVAVAFAYVPISVAVLADRVVVHANAGWLFNRRGDPLGGGSHVFNWALRTDATLAAACDRFTLIAEFFGENTASPQFQVGVRTVVISERLGIDLSWGGHTARDAEGTGWTAGIAWTPPPFN